MFDGKILIVLEKRVIVNNEEFKKFNIDFVFAIIHSILFTSTLLIEKFPGCNIFFIIFLFVLVREQLRKLIFSYFEGNTVMCQK